MNLLEVFLIGLEGLKVHKIRSILSVLGIVFGVASVVAVLSVIGGAQREVMSQMEALGSNNILIKAVPWQENIPALKKTRNFSKGLSIKDFDRLKSTLKNVDFLVPFSVSLPNTLIYEKPYQIEIFGTTSEFIKTVNFSIKEGRFLSKYDSRLLKKVCVVEEQLLQGLMGKKASYLNESIEIDHEIFQIVGVLKSKDIVEEKTQVEDVKSINKRIYIPLAVANNFLSRNLLQPELDGIIVKVPDIKMLKPLALLIDQLLLEWHQLDKNPKMFKDFKVQIAVDLFKQAESTQKIFNWIMGCSAGISLLVGGIGIMNIMLANLSERRKEVGIRLSIGAKQNDILFQFVFESAGLGIVGGIIGLGLGMLLTIIISSNAGWPTDISWMGAFVAISISIIDAILFGTYPAWKASKMDPVEALQDD